MKLELGGGTNPRGEGFVNLDKIETADIVFDLETVRHNVHLPFDDESVDEIYSCHCLEHITRIWPILVDMLRICKVGASVLIRVPHWLHQTACGADHKQVISDHFIRNELCGNHRKHLSGNLKRFELQSLRYVPEIYLDEIRDDFPNWDDEKIMRFIPGTCHEVFFHLRVIENV